GAGFTRATVDAGRRDDRPRDRDRLGSVAVEVDAPARWGAVLVADVVRRAEVVGGIHPIAPVAVRHALGARHDGNDRPAISAQRLDLLTCRQSNLEGARGSEAHTKAPTGESTDRRSARCRSKRHVIVAQRRRAGTAVALVTPVDALEEALGALVPALGVERHVRVSLAGIAHREGRRREAGLLLRGGAQLEDVHPDRLRELDEPGVQLAGDAV